MGPLEPIPPPPIVPEASLGNRVRCDKLFDELLNVLTVETEQGAPSSPTSESLDSKESEAAEGGGQDGSRLGGLEVAVPSPFSFFLVAACRMAMAR